MKFKRINNNTLNETFDALEEDILNEGTYGMTSKQSKKSLESALFSSRILPIIINSKEMPNGFTLHANRWGSGVQKSFGYPFIFHHMGLSRGAKASLTLLFSAYNHNEIHNDLRDLIRKVFNKYSNVLDYAFEEYEKQYKIANAKLKSVGDDDYYSYIGLKFKAYEDYFRNVRDKLCEVVEPEFIGTEIDRLIQRYNVISDNKKTTTEGDFDEIKKSKDEEVSEN